MSESTRPTLLSSCARATTREESAFRVNYPNSRTRATRIIALDEDAAAAMRAIEEQPWNGAHFTTFRAGIAGAKGLDNLPVDATLANRDGSEVKLSDEIAGADAVIMIVTAGASPDAAGIVGNACFERRIMSTGLVIAEESGTLEPTLKALRPYAKMLVVSSGTEYVPEMLTALRA